MLADIAQEIEHAHAARPVRVVEQQGLVREAGTEIEQPRELALDARDVGRQHLGREQVALGRLAARVSDHPGRTAGDGDGPVARELEPAQDEQADEVAEVQAVRGGIEADVERDRPRAGGEQLEELVAVGHVGNQTAPF